jgi:hypothetical protein
MPLQSIVGHATMLAKVRTVSWGWSSGFVWWTGTAVSTSRYQFPAVGTVAEMQDLRLWAPWLKCRISGCGHRSRNAGSSAAAVQALRRAVWDGSLRA